jgi:hypothetical protein
MLKQGPWKHGALAPETEALFNLDEDPHEEHDLAGDPEYENRLRPSASTCGEAYPRPRRFRSGPRNPDLTVSLRTPIQKQLIARTDSKGFTHALWKSRLRQSCICRIF